MATETATETVPEIKTLLNSLTKLSTAEFDAQFREWMSRDEVSRGLQAKLRSDLIANFNKTTLGKQLLSFTGHASSEFRLCLTPLLLALNNLVAEYLYAENCHFSLSVFCTEAPFRNTLPDFEVSPHFRFSKAEVNDILEALISTENTDNLKFEIARQYEETVNTSLLLLFMKSLLENLAKDRTEQRKLLIATVGTNTDQPTELNTSEHKLNAEEEEENDTQLQYLQNYLLLLTKKVSKMTREFQRFQLERYGVTPSFGPRSRIKSSRQPKYPTMYRNLERVTENLKRKVHAQRKNQSPVRLIVDAVDTLANQFGKCARSFENVSKAFSSKPVQQPVEKTTETEFHEKTYTDWVKEMNSTHNGQKFLNEVEVTLRKALDKQKEQLKNEVDMKLRHQKELLRIRYQQKVMDYMNKNNMPTKAEDEELLKEHLREAANIENAWQYEKLQKYEAQKRKQGKGSASEKQTLGIVLKYTPHKSPNEKSVTVDVGQQTTLPSATAHAPDAVPENYIKTRKRLKKLTKAFTEQDHVVDKIVQDAQLRMKELENESNQVEQNFRNYLERQKLQKEMSRDMSNKLWSNYVAERVQQVYRVTTDKCGKDVSDESGDEKHEDKTDEEAERLIKVATYEKPAHVERQGNDMSISEGKLKFKNAILEAKEKFFEESKLYKEITVNTSAVPKQPATTQESQSLFQNSKFDSTTSDAFIMPTVGSNGTAKSANVIGNFKRQLHNSTKGRRSASPAPRSKTAEAHEDPANSCQMTHRQWLATLKKRKVSFQKPVAAAATTTGPKSPAAKLKVAPAIVSPTTATKSPTKEATTAKETEAEEPTTSTGKISSSSALLRQSIAKIQEIFASANGKHTERQSENQVDSMEAVQIGTHTFANGGRDSSEDGIEIKSQDAVSETSSMRDIAANVNVKQSKDDVEQRQKLQPQKSDINSSMPTKKIVSKAIVTKESESSVSIESNASQKFEIGQVPSTATFVLHQSIGTDLSLRLSSSITSINSHTSSTSSQYSLASVPDMPGVEEDAVSEISDQDGEEVGELVDEYGRRSPIRTVPSVVPESDASTH